MPRGSTGPRLSIGQGCCQTTAPHTSPTTWRMDGAPRHGPRPRSSLSPDDPGENRALASDVEEPDSAGELLLAGRSGSPDRGLCGRLQRPPLPREYRQSNPGRRLLRARPDNPAAQRKDQTPDHRPTSLAASTASRVTSSTRG